jgi:hypothetical protein
MANQKECRCCGKLKDTTLFSKCSATKDKLQRKCKDCNKKDNHKFRTEINPQHHNIWQKNNWDKFVGYVKSYRKADKDGIIYAITNPEGKQYIGLSEMTGKVRFMEHRQHYKRTLIGKRDRLGLLHDSFDKYGMENHKFEVIQSYPNLDRNELKKIERQFIIENKQKNISLNSRN